MVKAISFLRWKNLGIIALIVLSLKYLVFESMIHPAGWSQFTSTFSLINTVLLIVSILMIAAGGYVINDINDVATDRINKNDETLLMDVLSEKQAFSFYTLLTVGGIALGVYLAYSIGFYKLAFFHLFSAGLLWLYSTYFKSSVLIGNVIVALLSALVPLCYFCFEAYAYIQSYGSIYLELFKSYFAVGPLAGLWGYTLTLSLFAFAFTLIREIIKDLEDLEGDSMLQGQTLPLAIGSKNTLWIVRVLIVIAISSLVYCYYYKFDFFPLHELGFQVYFYVAIITPCVLLFLETVKKEPDYNKASTICKFIMLFGILSCYIYYSYC